jgi:low temperature requirement protein LtrA
MPKKCLPTWLHRIKASHIFAQIAVYESVAICAKCGFLGGKYMNSSSSNFRRWWQPPRKTIDRPEDRSVTFLELFYDLVYVVLVAELAHSLATNAKWWVYFDFISGRLPLPGVINTRRWLYLHLPMTLGITAVGATAFNLVEHAGEPLSTSVRWLLAGSVALALACIAALMRSILVHEALYPYYRRGEIVTLGSGLLILFLGFTGLQTIPLLAVTAVLLLIPTIYGVVVWIKTFGGREIPIIGGEI